MIGLQIFGLGTHGWHYLNSLTIGLQLVLLGTHGMHLENFGSRQFEFLALSYILEQLDCLLVFFLFCEKKILFEAVGILSLSNYSWTIGL